jgi:hypothetical protein
MGNVAVNLPMTAEQYLAWEAQQPERWEFVGGEVFAMTGAARATGWSLATSTWRCAAISRERHVEPS